MYIQLHNFSFLYPSKNQNLYIILFKLKMSAISKKNSLLFLRSIAQSKNDNFLAKLKLKMTVHYRYKKNKQHEYAFVQWVQLCQSLK